VLHSFCSNKPGPHARDLEIKKREKMKTRGVESEAGGARMGRVPRVGKRDRGKKEGRGKGGGRSN